MTTAIATLALDSSIPHVSGKAAHKRRGRFIDAFAVIVLIGGIIGLIWPWASIQWSAYQLHHVVTNQTASVQSMNPAKRAEEFKKAQAYNDSLTSESVTDPFIFGSGAALPSLEKYNDALNVNGDGIMGSLEIPVIGVRLPIAHGTEDDTLQHAAGHIRQTSLPIGGAGTHSVIAAHRGLVHTEMFTRLNEMRVGDTFEIHVLDETLTYQVDQISIVEPDDLSKIAIEPDRDLVTLMTCTPYGINTQRLLVRGTRINPNDTTDIQTRNSWGLERLVRVACAVMGLILIIWLVVLTVRCRLRKSQHRHRH